MTEWDKGEGAKNCRKSLNVINERRAFVKFTQILKSRFRDFRSILYIMNCKEIC